MEYSPLVYSEDLPPLHMTGPSHVLLQVGPYYEDTNGEYCGGGVLEEEEENENEGRAESVEL